MADKYVKLEKYFDKVIAEWDKLIDMRIEAKAMIAMVPEGKQQAVLYARYINCEDWERVASDMNRYLGYMAEHLILFQKFMFIFFSIKNDIE